MIPFQCQLRPPRKDAHSKVTAVAINEGSFVTFLNRLEVSYVHAFEPCRRNTQEPTRRLYLLGILGINGEAPKTSAALLEYPRTPQEGSIFWGYWAFARRGRDRPTSASQDLSRLVCPVHSLGR